MSDLLCKRCMHDFDSHGDGACEECEDDHQFCEGFLHPDQLEFATAPETKE